MWTQAAGFTPLVLIIYTPSVNNFFKNQTPISPYRTLSGPFIHNISDWELP